MKKYILAIALIVIIFSTPAIAGAHYTTYEPLSVEIENSTSEITIRVSGNTLQISGAEGKTAKIYDIAGNLITEFEVSSNAMQIALNCQQGLYLIKIDKVVRKVQLR